MEILPEKEECIADFAKFKSEYKAPLGIFKNPNVEIIYGRIFRPARVIKYTREKFTLRDGDSINLNWSCVGSKTLTIVCPGLEGHSDWSYVRAVVTALNDDKIDAVVANSRGCGGPSIKFFFGIGEEADVSELVDFVLKTYDYSVINLVGYSTGGNLVAKYLADKADAIDPRINKAYIVSPTLDLYSTMRQFDHPKLGIYNAFFILTMLMRLWKNRKTYHRALKFSELFNVKTSTDFYNRFCYHDTGKEFKDYLDQHSAYPHLHKIKVPMQMIYAVDDYFLNPQFFPCKQAMENEYLDLEISKDGGHAGFVSFGEKYFWSEQEMINWFEEV